MMAPELRIGVLNGLKSATVCDLFIIFFCQQLNVEVFMQDPQF